MSLRTLVVLLCGWLAGCGWSAGLTAPDGHRTVGVRIFETERGLLQRNLEPILSDAMSEAVTGMVGAPLVAPSAADVVVEGRILAYGRRSGIRTTENELTETGLRLVLEAKLVDRKGDVVVPARQRHVWSGYALDERALVSESLARRRAVEYVAQTLVLDLFGIGAESAIEPGEAASARDER